MNCPYQFAIEFTGPDAQPLGQHPIDPDWLPAAEALRFDRQRLGNDTPLRECDMNIAPHWSEAGAPYVAGISVAVKQAPAVFIPVSFFRADARKIESTLVEQEKLKKGDSYTFKTVAYSRPNPPVPQKPGLFQIEEEEVASPLTDRDIDELLARSSTDEEVVESESSLRVFIPQHILDETRAIGEAAEKMETGGLLIGHVHRDPAKALIFLEVTAQIAATHTDASATSLTFNDDTWMAARAAIAIRNRNEQAVLWWHSHPSKGFCNDTCPMERRLKCALQLPFLSADDLLLHRAVFSKAWQAALLVNVADAGTTHTVWGWCEGTIRQIPFHVLDGAQTEGIAREEQALEATAA